LGKLLSLVRDEREREDKEAEDGDGSTKLKHENEPDGGSAFDTMCLILGLLTNLVQVVDGAKDVVLSSFFSHIVDAD
jgi:hypothetical protein